MEENVLLIKLDDLRLQYPTLVGENVLNVDVPRMEEKETEYVSHC